ncbi:MAG: tetratricopeptide repeat protein [Flavobacteriales bacterium]
MNLSKPKLSRLLILWSLIMVVLTFTVSTSAQTDSELSNVSDLYQLEAYHKIIDTYKDSLEGLDAGILMFVGKSYFMVDEDQKCVDLMDKIIAENDSLSMAFYYRGKAQFYLKEINSALENIEKAITLNSEDPYFHSFHGAIFIELNDFGKAVKAYEKAVELDETDYRSMCYIPQLYADLGEDKKALSKGYEAKELMDKESKFYTTVLYNISLFEAKDREFEKAKSTLLELIEIDPADYQAQSKLIQAYYGLGEFSKSEQHKEVLYKAKTEELLPQHMMDMFCIDQFEWKGREIRVFERYEENLERLYYKHIFYVLDEDGSVVDQIQTENSPVSAELGGARYAIGRNKGASHFTFTFIEDNYDYIELKDFVIQILEDDVNAAASSSVGSGSDEESKKSKKKRRKNKQVKE